MTANIGFAIFAAYLIGSVPFGYLAGRLCGVDLRKTGSGNIGATNALRVLGKVWGYSVFLCDFLKGAAGVLVAGWLAPQPWVPILAALVVVLGHVYPVWLGFRGGKGIATSAGVLLALIWPAFLVSLTLWLLLFFTTRYVSIASIAASLALPATALVLFLRGQADAFLLGITMVMAAVTVWRHRANVARLLNGTEPKFEVKRKTGTKSAETGGGNGNI